MTSPFRLRRRAPVGVAWPEPATMAWAALGAALVLVAIFLFRETRGTTFNLDEWSWITQRRGSGLGTFLDPHNSHLSLVPVALYKLLFATAGLGDYVPYRIMVIVAHLAVAALVFVYARRRVGDFLALVGAGLMLLLGPGSQNIVWPFGITYLLSLAPGVAAFLMLDRGDRRGDVAACALLAVSLASSGLGVSIALGVIVDVLWGRRRWRDAWIFVVPLALYAVWWVAYEQTDVLRHNLVVTPGFVADGVSASVAALVGLGGTVIPNGPGTLYDWGRPLALALAAVVAWRLARGGRIPPRVLSLLAVLGSFWVFTAVNRAQISAPFTSRYVYVGALFVLLTAVEVARGTRVPWRVGIVTSVVAVAALASNFGVLRDAARYQRDISDAVRADLGALQIAQRSVNPHRLVKEFPGYPFVQITAGTYFAAARALGTPAWTPAQIAAAKPGARQVADAQLVGAYALTLAPGPARQPLGSQPSASGVAGGALSRRGACVGFTPAPATAPDAARYVELAQPPGGGLLVTAAGGGATVGVRRFGDTVQPVGRLSPSAPVVLRIPGDSAPRPWLVRVTPDERATACELAPQ